MEEKIITIATFPYSRAQLIKVMLDSEGVDCFLSNVNLVQPQVSGGVKIRISEKDAEKALRIIEKIKEEYGESKRHNVERLKRIRRILVPVDFSDASLNACDFAVGLAIKLKAEIKLLYAYFNPVIISEPFLEENTYSYQMDEVIRNIEPEAKEKMKEFIGLIKERAKSELPPRFRITYQLESGSPEDVITNWSEKWNPGVIVMGTQRSGDDAFSSLGSVTRKIITKSANPLLVIPEHCVYRGISYFSKILYATDFDFADFKSLGILLTLIRPFDLRLYCIHIATDDDTTIDETRMNHFRERLEEEYKEFDIHCELKQHSDVAQGLEEYSEVKEIDLLALTTRKRGIIDRLFNPSLAKQMIFHTHVPLLIFQS